MGSGRHAPLPTIERGRRCQNCRHFDNGPLAIQHYKARRFADLQRQARNILGGQLPQGPQRLAEHERGRRAPPQKTAAQLRAGARQVLEMQLGQRGRTGGMGFEDVEAALRALGLNYDLGDQLLRNGELGVCQINAAPGDFVQMGYFCGVKYEPRVRVDDGHKHDETSDEARDRLGIPK